MSHFLSQTINQQMRLEQKLTPQLIQSMSILQKSVADLEAYIAEELESNPALEVADPEPGKDESNGEGQPGVSRDGEGADSDRFARLERFARTHDLDSNEWGAGAPRRAASTGERDAKMDAMANTAGREPGLHENLLDQWALTEADSEIRRAGEAIITKLDPDGYLRVSFELIAEDVKPPLSVEVLEEALLLIRERIEPAGVTARDLKECLLLQLEALRGDNQIERKLIEDHLDDMAHNRLPLIAKSTGYSVGEIKEAINAMRSTLCLHPGFLVGDRSVPTIRPDVIVEYAETGGGLTVRLARGNSPLLRVSERLAALAKSKANGKETRDFARKHVENAGALIDAVVFRRSRMLDVAEAIILKQQEFFEIGPQGLKIYRMSDLAGQLGCDPSTISRTVADKYLETSHGVFPMRYFFTGGTDTGNGAATSWDSVKMRVSAIVKAEDPTKPLNDDQIAAALEKENIRIKRRTVAKYRAQLNIPPARQRRKF